MKHLKDALLGKIIGGVDVLLMKLGNAKRNEAVCIISDKRTRELGQVFLQRSLACGLRPLHFCIEPLTIHGTEPPVRVARAMEQSALIIGLTWNSMAHTQARFRACNKGSRYLSLPGYTDKILCHAALRKVNYSVMARPAERLAKIFTRGMHLEVKTTSGTNLRFDVRGRSGNFCPGYVNARFRLGSPPDIEANIAPIENSSQGVIVVDGSIPYAGFGRIKREIELHVKKGKIVKIDGEQCTVKRLNALFDRYGSKARVLAEFGVGFNKKARLCGNMLMDEGAYGTVHFGFGSNATIGGINSVPFHVDFVCLGGLIRVDGQTVKF